MVQINHGLAAISSAEVSLYYTTDPLLSNSPLLIFHGASTTTNATQSSSRIQIHVFSAAGFQSYPRLTISPASPLYEVVNELPREWQGDEVCRGLAFGLLKYFQEIPEVVKSALIVQSAHSRGKRLGSAPPMFGKQHAASLASTMVRVENCAEILADIETGIQLQNISNIDVDLVLPPGSIIPLSEGQDEETDEDDTFDPSLRQYGQYAPLVKLFGETVFVPTSKIRRAPSKPTPLSRSRSFLKDQKMSLRREMAELVDTEERYVMKMHELVNNIAEDFRAKAKNKPFGSFSPSDKDLERLFPKSIDKILNVNTEFLAAIKTVMDETEEDAMQDLEAEQVTFGSSRSRYGGSGKVKDPTGALAFAKILLEWFPQFSDCYQDYIRASQDFPQLITSFVRQQSSFSQRLQNTGEQRLRSAIIEPVQRLPRYSLFIDNIVKYLPLSHPAMQSMLKARDIITTICSLDPPAADKSQLVNRLKTMVDRWPSNLFPQGRLISAADFVELPPPYHISRNATASYPGLLLLFADTIVVIRKTRDSAISARGLLAEVDKPSAATMMASATAAANGQRHVPELSLVGWHALSDTRFSETQDGRVVWMSASQEFNGALSTGKIQPNSPASKRAFLLQGAFEAKASKWAEEVTKARVEGRFSEKERESEGWCLRNINLKDFGLNMYAAVFEEGIDTLIEGRKEPAPVRIVVDHEKGTKGAPIGHYGVETVVNVTTAQQHSGLKYHLLVTGLNDKSFGDSVDQTTFMPIFAKRVGDLIKTQHGPGNPALTASFILCYSRILNVLNVELETDKAKYYRPPSPVKLLSSFLSGGSLSSAPSTANKLQRPQNLGNVPNMKPPSLSRASSKVDTPASSTGSRPASADSVSNPLVRLEETFTGYIAALQSRKGNIVGRMIISRASADELHVNAIYNVFIENPFDTRTSAEAPVDVLFCAFEKFLRMAWKDQMGPVVSVQTLQALQAKASKLYPGDFADYIKTVFGELAPQNKRAFVSIVKLLADLLEGCGNDGDRGALTAAFAELLVGHQEPHSYINLLDRMVEDCDRLFDDIGPGPSNGFGTPLYGSLSSTMRSNVSTNTGSVTSNTSSLRKRFGFDSLLRQNSKNEGDSKPSMWRTLSKTTRSMATGEPITASFSKGATLQRTMSDADTRPHTPRRPGSRDRPTVLGAFDERPSSSHTPSRLSTIGQSPPPEPASTEKSLKKKRRSSLSDLKALMASATIDSPSALTPRRLNQIPQPKFNSSPRTPSPSKATVTRSIAYAGSPRQKENSPIREVGNLTERSQNVMSEDAVVVRDLWSPKGHNKAMSTSNIPVLKNQTRELSSIAASPAPAPLRLNGSPSKGSPHKLRLQSPQKLRERLQNEAKAINDAEASLQSELSKIGEEMAKLNAASPARSGTSSEVRKISDSLKTLESRIPILIKEMTSRNETVKKDLETSLQASEYKVKGLDQLYKEASAENEILYEKFNGELGKIVKALKGKGKEDKEELITKMKEASEETARVKKENARLRREMLSIRTLLKAAEHRD